MSALSPPLRGRLRSAHNADDSPAPQLHLFYENEPAEEESEEETDDSEAAGDSQACVCGCGGSRATHLLPMPSRPARRHLFCNILGITQKEQNELDDKKEYRIARAHFSAAGPLKRGRCLTCGGPGWATSTRTWWSSS